MVSSNYDEVMAKHFFQTKNQKPKNPGKSTNNGQPNVS